MVWVPGKNEAGRRASRPGRRALFVAAANTNNVYAVGVSEAKELRTVEAINVATDAAASRGHDAQRAGAQPGSEAAVRGLLGCECGGRRRCLAGAQPRAGLYSHRLVSHRGARAAGRHAGGAQRPGPALLPEPARTESHTPARTACTRASRRSSMSATFRPARRRSSRRSNEAISLTTTRSRCWTTRPTDDSKLGPAQADPLARRPSST